jgi:glycosyltransferase involved in cell wall biosynthesis
VRSAICLIVRNEARDIQEWIAFHGLAGFDTQIIFDNRSTDATPALIQAASRHYDIRFHDWDNRSPGTQVLAYMAACEAYQREFDWMAFLDSDEFLVTPRGEAVNDFLAGFDGWSAIGLNWAVYGANGHEAWPDGLVVENFTRRAPPAFFPARHVKSIVRPGLARACGNPHYFDMREARDGHYCDGRGQYMLWHQAPEVPGGVLRGVSRAAPDYALGRVNHYFTRSRAHWQAKLARGYPSDFLIRKQEEFDQYNRNEITDPVALRRVGALRQAVARLRHSSAG